MDAVGQSKPSQKGVEKERELISSLQEKQRALEQFKATLAERKQKIAAFRSVMEEVVRSDKAQGKALVDQVDELIQRIKNPK